MTTEENSWLRSVKEKLRGRKKRLQDHHLHHNDHDDHDDEEEDGYGHRRHGHTVYRVPRQLREVRPQAYEPLVIALGPYRKSRKQEPSPTEAHLSISAASLLFAHLLQEDDDHDDTSFHNLTTRIVGHDINRILNHYERPPSYDKEEVSALFTLDSAFLTGFLLHFGCTFSAAANTNTQLELGKRMAAELKLPRRLNDRIIRDLFLMENQIPLNLLKKVLNVSCLESNAPHEFSMCILSIISHANPFQAESGGHIAQRVYKFSVKDRKHLLDCLYAQVSSPSASLGKQYTTYREVCLQEDESFTQEEGHDVWIIDVMDQAPTAHQTAPAMESAVHLCLSGIKFKTATPSSNQSCRSLWFDERSGTLYLPRIKIGPESESLLRNLAAYETVACQRAELGSYLSLMDDLIDTAEDVQVLRSSGVLLHSLKKDSEVANLWNSLCTNLQVLYESKEVKEAYAGIRRHLQRKKRYRAVRELAADFAERYLSAPWLIASVLAAVLLLILSVLQTVYTVAAYYNASNGS